MEPSDTAPFQGLAVSSHREEDLKLPRHFYKFLLQLPSEK